MAINNTPSRDPPRATQHLGERGTIPFGPAVTTGDFVVAPSVPVASRTLTVAGFEITNCVRHPGYAALECERLDAFGAMVRYHIVLCEGAAPPRSDLPNIKRDAQREHRLLVIVTEARGAEWIAWNDFLLMLGGAVPAWRALGSEYDEALLTLAANRLPAGSRGEAWRLFEEAVADGLEFLFGNRVRRLGGAARGARVPDLLAHTPDERLLVVDTKASKDSFDASWPELRPLVEYVERQQGRQRGAIEVASALVVAPAFEQDADGLVAVGSQFLVETHVPASFLTADVLLKMVTTLRNRPRLRTAINWGSLLCQPRLVSVVAFEREVESAVREKIDQSNGAGSRSNDSSNATNAG
jgi:hypothetical protein